METENLILVEQICTHHNIETSFVDALQAFGLIEVVVLENNRYLSNEQLRDLEKMMRLHYDLHLNLEGIDVVYHLLKRIDDLQQKLVAANNKLRLLD